MAHSSHASPYTIVREALVKASKCPYTFMSTYKYKNVSSLTSDLVKRDLYLVIQLISSLSGKASWEFSTTKWVILPPCQTVLSPLSPTLRKTVLFIVRKSSNNPSSHTQSSSLIPCFILFYLLGNHSLSLLRETCLSFLLQKWHPKLQTQLPILPTFFWHPLKWSGLLRAKHFPSQPLAQIWWIKYAQYL